VGDQRAVLGQDGGVDRDGAGVGEGFDCEQASMTCCPQHQDSGSVALAAWWSVTAISSRRTCALWIILHNAEYAEAGVAAAAAEPGAAGSAASTCGWSDTDALGGQELAGAAQLTVACEGVPPLVEVLLVHEIAEPAECARAFDRPLQPLP